MDKLDGFNGSHYIINYKENYDDNDDCFTKARVILLSVLARLLRAFPGLPYLAMIIFIFNMISVIFNMMMVMTMMMMMMIMLLCIVDVEG